MTSIAKRSTQNLISMRESLTFNRERDMREILKVMDTDQKMWDYLRGRIEKAEELLGQIDDELDEREVHERVISRKRAFDEMREQARISAAYSAAMSQSYHDDPTGQDYEFA